MTVPERPKNISPRAWAVATAHLKDTPPKEDIKPEPPKIEDEEESEESKESDLDNHD